MARVAAGGVRWSGSNRTARGKLFRAKCALAEFGFVLFPSRPLPSCPEREFFDVNVPRARSSPSYRENTEGPAFKIYLHHNLHLESENLVHPFLGLRSPRCQWIQDEFRSNTETRHARRGFVARSSKDSCPSIKISRINRAPAALTRGRSRVIRSAIILIGVVAVPRGKIDTMLECISAGAASGAGQRGSI